MPGRLADLHDDIRRMVAELDKRRFRLKKNPTSATGFVNVIKVKGKYQARLQVPGEGRGGQIKRVQAVFAGHQQPSMRQRMRPSTWRGSRAKTIRIGRTGGLPNSRCASRAPSSQHGPLSKPTLQCRVQRQEWHQP